MWGWYCGHPSLLAAEMSARGGRKLGAIVALARAVNEGVVLEGVCSLESGLGRDTHGGMPWSDQLTVFAAGGTSTLAGPLPVTKH